MDNLWKRINAIVPNPKCRTFGDELVEWSDERTQPSEEELLAVDVAAIYSAEEAQRQELSLECGVNPLAGMTFSEIEAHIDANVTTIATVKIYLKSLSRLLLATKHNK